VSVLIPAYNAAQTIGEALESVLAQSPQPFEVVVSDDGSTDDLGQALRPFREHVRVVRGENAGLAVARNRAAGVARGDLFALLDADDVWLPGRIAALADAAARRPDLAVLTTDAVVTRDGTPDPETYYATREFSVEAQEVAILRNSFVFGAGAIRADVFRAAGGYRAGARHAEDWDLWLRLLLAGYRAGLVEQPLYEYRRRVGSLTAQKIELSLGVLDVLRRARRLISTAEQRHQLQVTEQQWRENAARAAIRVADGRARRMALRAATGLRASPRARVRFAAAAIAPAASQRARPTTPYG
jgi:glycosyltransferase involved in cell wall biosynthesis